MVEQTVFSTIVVSELIAMTVVSEVRSRCAAQHAAFELFVLQKLFATTPVNMPVTASAMMRVGAVCMVRALLDQIAKIVALGKAQ